MLDSHLGEGFRALTYVDPAISDGHPRQRNAALDLFDPANGYTAASNAANYSDAFAKKFFAAQAARNEKLVAAAQARLSAIEKGQGKYKGDEPFEVPEICCARLLQADTRFVSHTKASHPLLKTDGTTPTQIIKSVRPAMGQDPFAGLFVSWACVSDLHASDQSILHLVDVLEHAHRNEVTFQVTDKLVNLHDGAPLLSESKATGSTCTSIAFHCRVQ